MSFQMVSEISSDSVREAMNLQFVRTELLGKLEPPRQNVTILKGARGIGKSTLLLQFLHQQQLNKNKVLYISADSSLLDMGLAELAHEYRKRGGVYLAYDDIHKYPGWQAEVKTILDAFPQLKLLVSGSSSINLDSATVDLSRRHVMLAAKGLSLREYLAKNYQLNFPTCSLADVLANAQEMAQDIVRVCRDHQLDLLEIFHQYLRSGYFISRDNYSTEALYYDSLLNSMSSIVDADIANVHPDVDNLSRQKMKLLLKQLASKCPFTPNIAELSRGLSISNDNTLKKYLYYLAEGEILTNLYVANKTYKDFQKPQKILLNNTNYVYAHDESPLVGTVRETFAANCLQSQGRLTAPSFGDFCLDEQWVFEIGGRSKNKRQVKSIKNSYVLADDILTVDHERLPLWLLGFLW